MIQYVEKRIRRAEREIESVLKSGLEFPLSVCSFYIHISMIRTHTNRLFASVTLLKCGTSSLLTLPQPGPSI